MTATGVLGVIGRGVPIGWGLDVPDMGDKVSSWDGTQGTQRRVSRLTAVTLGTVPPGMAINPRRSGGLVPWRDGNVRWVFLFDRFILTSFLVVLQSLCFRLISRVRFLKYLECY